MDVEVTKAPLTLSHDPQLDWLIAVEFGVVLDGKADEEYIPIDEDCAFARRDVGGPVIGFVLLAWRACLTTGNPKAHFGLGYTLWELGRHHEAYRHLRHYTELAPRNSWAWCWLGKACASLRELEEARTALHRAIELEEAGSFETDAPELLAQLVE